MKRKTKKSFFLLDISFGGTGLTQISLFAKHLAVMLKSGMPITEALIITIDSVEGRLKRVLKKVLKSVKSGSSLSSSLAAYPRVFPAFFINSTYAGETSGTLDKNLEKVAEDLEKEKELRMKIRGALLYPVMVLIATFILGLLLAYFVLPKITPMFEGLNIELPATTKALIWLTHLIQDRGIWLLVSIIAVIAFFTWFLRQKFIKPITHWFFLHTPLIGGIVKRANLTRFCRSLALLLRSGLHIDEALKVTEKIVSNFYYRKALNNITQSISRGRKLSSNLEQFKDLFPLTLIHMIRVGEESGRLEETLQYLSNFYEKEVDNAVKNLSTTIEPILLAIIGLVVAFLGLSIISPMYEITGGIKGR